MPMIKPSQPSYHIALAWRPMGTGRIERRHATVKAPDSVEAGRLAIESFTDYPRNEDMSYFAFSITRTS